MQYLLSITSIIDTDAQGHELRSPITAAMAETDLGPFSRFGFPDSFGGKLVAVTPEQLLAFKFDSGVEVGFRGKRYNFEQLENDGSFELSKGW
jgi:hypothetical protein